jgi:hypothetical protein
LNSYERKIVAKRADRDGLQNMIKSYDGGKEGSLHRGITESPSKKHV